MTRAAEYANAFAPALKQAVELAVTDKAQTEKKIEELRAKKERIDQELMQLQHHLDSIDRDLALGLTHAAREAGVRVNLADGGNGSGRRAPADRKPTDEDVKKLVAVLPQGEQNAMTMGAIKKAIDISDVQIVPAALSHLLSDRNAKAVGQRRGKRYYR